jgi:plasmid stabilization system protein ParE
MRVRYTPRARDDLAEILKYLDDRSPQGSRNVKRTIRKTIELICQFPLWGETLRKGNPRLACRYPYLIYWSVDGDSAWIVHIRDGRRAPWTGH